MHLPSNSPPTREYSAVDTLINRIDGLIKSALGPHVAGRPYPAEYLPETLQDSASRTKVAGLMRVNHAGEICAQALYHGQAATAKLDGVRDSLTQAAQEEVDHLAWCARRLQELHSRPSRLDPLWYTGSFAIGALAGISGDRHSLGFVAETERQVVAHLQSHLEQLPAEDVRTRAVLEQMQEDEARHGGDALSQGGQLPPLPIRTLMKMTAKVMTFAAQRI